MRARLAAPGLAVVAAATLFFALRNASNGGNVYGLLLLASGLGLAVAAWGFRDAADPGLTAVALGLTLNGASVVVRALRNLGQPTAGSVPLLLFAAGSVVAACFALAWARLPAYRPAARARGVGFGLAVMAAAFVLYTLLNLPDGTTAIPVMPIAFACAAVGAAAAAWGVFSEQSARTA